MWREIKDELCDDVEKLTVGDVTDAANFMGAVIDDRAFAKHVAAIDAAKADPTCTVLAGGTYDSTTGLFVRPTIIEAEDPQHELFRTEYFGPILAIYVYPDGQFEQMASHIANTSTYALTGAVFSRDRQAIDQASVVLQNAAGNFYINDKPTGAVVGQQPFGGARASGTNDKAGSPDNLRRWTSVRAIKENLNPPQNHLHPHQGASS